MYCCTGTRHYVESRTGQGQKKYDDVPTKREEEYSSFLLQPKACKLLPANSQPEGNPPRISSSSESRWLPPLSVRPSRKSQLSDPSTEHRLSPEPHPPPHLSPQVLKDDLENVSSKLSPRPASPSRNRDENKFRDREGRDRARCLPRRVSSSLSLSRLIERPVGVIDGGSPSLS